MIALGYNLKYYNYDLKTVSNIAKNKWRNEIIAIVDQESRCE